MQRHRSFYTKSFDDDQVQKKINLLLNILCNKIPKWKGCKEAIHFRNKLRSSNISIIGSHASEL